MARPRTAPACGMRLGIHSVDANTVEQWYEHANDPRRVLVRVFRRGELDLWSEDTRASRTAERSRWDAIERTARASLQKTKLDHPLWDVTETFETTSFNERSLRHRMLFEILDEIVDAEITGDHEWLVECWRQAALRYLGRNRWVRSAGEPPLRRGPTRGAVQRQLLEAARAGLEPLSKKHSAADTKKLAKNAVASLARSITDNFPLTADLRDANLTPKATERVAPEVLERLASETGFPSEDTVRWFVRRTLAACGLPDRAVHTFFHAEHEKKFRERAKSKANKRTK